MWIKTQDGDLLNSDKVYRFYADDSKVYAQIEGGERWSDLLIGKYKTAERAKSVLNAMLDALHHGRKTFEMPPKDIETAA